jgi:hypothetical protein
VATTHAHQSSPPRSPEAVTPCARRWPRCLPPHAPACRRWPRRMPPEDAAPSVPASTRACRRPPLCRHGGHRRSPILELRSEEIGIRDKRDREEEKEVRNEWLWERKKIKKERGSRERGGVSVPASLVSGDVLTRD